MRLTQKSSYLKSISFALAIGVSIAGGGYNALAAGSDHQKSYPAMKKYGDKASKKKKGYPDYSKKNPYKEEKKWWQRIFPLGDRVEVNALKDTYVPFTTDEGVISSRQDVYHKKGTDAYKNSGNSNFVTAKKNKDLLPKRPKLLFEAGNGFLDTGNLDAGFEIPVLGAVWQPRLWAYAINRTALQSFDNGLGAERESELANRLDLFFNLQLTGTEKIILGLRPTDRNNPRSFTRYTFEGRDEGFNNELNISDVETLFFEGDLGSLFPNLDKYGVFPLDFGFTVGRQPLVFQEGILINDTIDAVGFIRNNIPVPGTSNFRVSGMWGWNRLDRNDVDDVDENFFGLFIAADAKVSTFNLDAIYVDAENETSGIYFGASAIQRLQKWGGISSAFRVNASFATEEEVTNTIGTGVLLTAELSKNVKGSDDILYFNSALNIGNFTQAGREAVVGGPLANTGILFASPNLSTYGAEINPFTTDDLIAGAIGYQAFWNNKRTNLILEAAFRQDLTGEGLSSYGVGAQLQHAVGRRTQLTFETFYTHNDSDTADVDDGFGWRAEVQIVY